MDQDLKDLCDRCGADAQDLFVVVDASLRLCRQCLNNLEIDYRLLDEMEAERDEMEAERLSSFYGKVTL